jgi:hypothetical protein
MKAPKGEHKEFEKHPEGMCNLVCSRIIDKGTTFNEKLNKYVRKILLVFESDKLMTSGDYKGEPFIVVQSFTYSMFQNAKLCQFVEMWRGKKFKSQEEADDFDLSTLVGSTVIANIVHNGDFVNIGSVMPLAPGMKPLEIHGDTYIFDMGDGVDEKVFEKLSDKMKAQIVLSKEYVAWEKTQKRNVPTQKGYDERNPPLDEPVPF